MTHSTETPSKLRVFSTLAVRAAFDKGIVSGYDQAGLLEIEWSPTKVIEKKLADKQHADLVIATDEAVATLVDSGHIDKNSCYFLPCAYLGVAVASGQKKPDISTQKAFLQALCDARSVAYSLSGASGIYLQEMMHRVGIYDQVAAKATKVEQGFTGERLLTGEASLAVQQMSELLVVDGTDIVGPFPDEVQHLTPFTVAIMRDCIDVTRAKAFVDYLLSASCMRIYQDNGLKIR